MSWLSRTSWPATTTACGTSALVLGVALLPSTEGALPFVGRVAQLALAGGAAYLIDDAAAALTTVAPRSMWRRRAPVLAQGAALLIGGWIAVVLALAWREVPMPVIAASGELVVLGLVATAAATVLARTGDPEPGGRVGPALVLVGIGLLVAEPVLRHPILLPWDRPPDSASVLAWAGAGLLAIVIALWASRDPAARRADRLGVSAAARRPRRRCGR